MRQQADATIETVHDFWNMHVNNEYYTAERRASEAYFDEIETRRYAWHYHLRELFDSLQGSHGKLLEIGCGIGVDSIQLAKCGFDVTAIDLTENALAIAKDYAALRNVAIDFRLGNAENLEFEDSSFDVVYSFGVLHHTPDIESSVAEVHRVLKPGGKAYIMLYHKYSIVNAVHGAFRLPYESPRDRDDHCPVVYTYSRRGIRALFSGFANVTVEAAYPFTFGFGSVATKTPLTVRKALGRTVGWHLMLAAVR